MNNSVLKCLTLLGLRLLAAAIIPQIACAQIDGSDKARPFNTTHHSPPSVTAVSSWANGIEVTLLAGASSFILDPYKQLFFPAEAFRTDFFKIDENKINFTSGIGIAYDKVLEPGQNKPWNILQSISLGLNAYYNESSRSGSVYEYSLPDFNNSIYHMNIKSYRVMLETEWTLHPLFFGMMPFVEGGIGGAQNTMSFQNIPRPNIGANGGNYSLSKTRTGFAYELGAGIKMLLNHHVTVSARYLFADTGKAQSGVFDSTTGVLLASPVQTLMQSQSVLFGLSYFFG